MSELAKLIIAKKMHCVFISPHHDDVILSCATLLSELKGKTQITVINVFTKAHKKPYTHSAKTFMKYSNGYTDATALYKDRIKEDATVFANLGITPINLGLEDALFRRQKNQSFLGKFLPEFDHIYPTYRWHIIKNVAKNDPAIETLTQKLKSYISPRTLVFTPYALGNHADHRVIRIVSESLFANLIIYSDFPYNKRFKTYGKPFPKGKTYRLAINKPAKEKLIRGYKTQVTGLFPNGDIPTHEEVYFSKPTVLNK